MILCPLEMFPFPNNLLTPAFGTGRYLYVWVHSLTSVSFHVLDLVYVNLFVDRTPTEHWTLMALLTWMLQATTYQKMKELICWDVLYMAPSNSSPSWGSPTQLGRWFGHKRLSIGFILLTTWRYVLRYLCPIWVKSNINHVYISSWTLFPCKPVFKGEFYPKFMTNISGFLLLLLLFRLFCHGIC